MRGEGLVSLEELANALTEQGDVNYYGQPYTAGSLHKMIQRMNKSDEELDREEMLILHEQHKDALNKLHPSVQSVH